MSIPKYITTLTKPQKIVKYLALTGIIISLIVWIIHILLEIPSNLFLILIYPEIFIFWACLVVFAYLHMLTWKENLYNYENDIFETIAYRKKTSIKNISKVKKINEKIVEIIIQRLIEQDKLFGVIRDGLFISDKTMSPICTICNKEIEDILLNMVLCPYCKRPFHKDHIIDYLNEMEEKCPNCKKILSLADIIK